MDEPLNLLPHPASVYVDDAACRIPLLLPVYGSAADEALEEWRHLQPFADRWELEFALTEPSFHVSPPLITVFDTDLPVEGYRLKIKADSAKLAAADRTGLFYGLLTLLQLVSDGHREGDELVLPTLSIHDHPRFHWRGMHLDVARHFFPVEVVKRYLDVLALHRINVFHWHLTDDQGWRIEIKSRPRLTEVGAWRTEADGTRYGGFYTRDEIRDVVQYAADRHITIVPEIEMPGHVRAALAAYPELSCTGETQPVPHNWDIYDDVLCVGKDATFAFIDDVLDEVCNLFPGEYIHIGGDECPNIRWQACPECQRRMRDENIESYAALQHWFTRRMHEALERRGKRLIGWDEILTDELPQSAVVMAWRSQQQGFKAAEAGHDVIMCPTSHCYFDYAQAEADEPEAFPATLTLDDALAFNPAPANWPDEVRAHILGGQGDMWTERIADEAHLQYMLLPRLCALSERLWSPTSTDQAEFRLRVASHLQRLEQLGYNYRPLTS